LHAQIVGVARNDERCEADQRMLRRVHSCAVKLGSAERNKVGLQRSRQLNPQRKRRVFDRR
jgi:hypothetical protein